MSIPITITLSEDAKAILANFQAFPDALTKSVCKVMDQQNQFTVGYAQVHKMSGKGNDTLAVRSGRLRSSLFSTPAKGDANRIESQIGSNVVYAAIHEFGGTTSACVITPRTKKALAFMVGGRMVFAKKVYHPGSVIPERSYVRSSIEERMDEYGAAISGAVVDSLTGGSES